ncbi:MAG: hypothetical protein JNM06_04660 [Blastocatellia bacterium]|nr:hypothetical protein [Blastocatellia bacterium]
MKTAVQSDKDLLKLINFNEKSAEIYYSLNKTGLSGKEWTVYPFNQNQLPTNQLESINIINEMNHKSGQGTFFHQEWLANRLDVCKRTVQYWLNKFRCLGIIKVENILHNGKWINSYTVTAEFSKYKCAADGILKSCNKQDHSECVRPQVDYTCTSCHRFQAGLSIEQQHQRDIDTFKTSINTLKQDYEQKISSLEQELAKTKAFRAAKATAKEERKLSKAKAREQFLSKLTPAQVAVIHSYEAITGRSFDVEKDLRAFNQISKEIPLVAIIGIIQTAINLLFVQKEGYGTTVSFTEIDQAIERARIHSLQYCVQQVEKVGQDFRSTFSKLDNINPSKTIMGYLGSTIAVLDATSALEIMGVIKTIPEKDLGGKAAILHLLSSYASKQVVRHIKAGLIDEEDKQAVFEETLGTLLIEFKLRC